MSESDTVVHDPINRVHLDEITGGDSEFAEELLVEFVDSTGKVIPQLRAALDSSDPVAVKSAAHAIKGASLSVGADVMSAAARALEENASAGSIEGAEDLFAALTENFAVVADRYGPE